MQRPADHSPAVRRAGAPPAGSADGHQPARADAYAEPLAESRTGVGRTADELPRLESVLGPYYMSDQINHYCGLAFVRLRQPLSYY